MLKSSLITFKNFGSNLGERGYNIVNNTYPLQTKSMISRTHDLFSCCKGSWSLIFVKFSFCIYTRKIPKSKKQSSELKA